MYDLYVDFSDLMLDLKKNKMIGLQHFFFLKKKKKEKKEEEEDGRC
jgi:hypothetical protein